MYNYYKLKCLDCDDIIKIEFDTRKNPKSERIKCNCGNLLALTNNFSFAYSQNSKYEIIEEHSEVLNEDFFIMNDETYKKYLEVKELAKELEFDIEENSNKEFDKLSNVCISYGENFKYCFCEFIGIKLDIHLQFSDSFDYDKVNKDINYRLDNFYKFLSCVKKDKTILNKYQELFEGKICGDIDFDRYKEQVKKYDYSFSF